MWELSLPWWHFVLRGVIVYASLLLLLRLTGKRQVGQLTPFDMALLLLISNALQNAMNGGDNSITAGLILALTLIVLNLGVGWLTSRSHRAEQILEGRPEVLMHRGHVYQDVLARQHLSQEDLKAALRQSGCFEFSDVEFAVLEINGAITVKPRDKKN